MEISIRKLLDGLEDSSVPMEEPDVVSAMRIKELTRMKIEQENTRSVRYVRKRIITLILAAVLILALGVTAYAMGEIFEYRKIKNDSALQEQSDRGEKDLQRFTFAGLSITPVDEALYLNNEKGQSGVTDFWYTVDGTDKQIMVSYYDSGEINTMDARDLYPVDYSPYDYGIDWFNAKYPDLKSYKDRLIEAAPGLIDTLHNEGWIKHSKEDIVKIGIQDSNVFIEPSAVIRVLTKDNNGYELWLEPNSLSLEGFMYWNAKDTQVIRNGFFPALKEDRVEEWWNELISDPNTLG
ncbi:MAG: hypothetical protein IJH53_07035 [Oscillospiraceae bacterium]|nr:hypothetical protein [Oscillospiraceae bacterium]